MTAPRSDCVVRWPSTRSVECVQVRSIRGEFKSLTRLFAAPFGSTPPRLRPASWRSCGRFVPIPKFDLSVVVQRPVSIASQMTASGFGQLGSRPELRNIGDSFDINRKSIGRELVAQRVARPVAATLRTRDATARSSLVSHRANPEPRSRWLASRHQAPRPHRAVRGRLRD